MNPPGVLVVERVGDRLWQVEATQVLQPQCDLVEFAEFLATERGGARVRLVVLVSDEGSDQVVLARTPRHVCIISRLHTLGYCAPEDWKKFLVIDAGVKRRAAIVVRSGADLTVLELQLERVAEIEGVAASMGIRQCLWASRASCPAPEAFSGLPHIEIVDGDAYPIKGAVAYANSIIAREGGVWLRDNLVTSVRASRLTEYSIHRPPLGVFDTRDRTLGLILDRKPIFIVADAKVAKLYAHEWSAYATEHLNVLGGLTIDATETAKTLRTAERICEAALQAALPRNGVILAIGGGITLDTAGLAASMLRRGVGYVRIPTTLVGLVDVAVGIKQGVNAWGKKNAIGCFYPPIASVNDYRLLATLPEQDIACGMAEIAKMALLRDPELFDLIDGRAELLLSSRFQAPPALAEEISSRAELLMMEELAPNLFEAELKRIVDFGHTFSPTIESRSNYSIPHGLAVALDIMISVAIGVRREVADPLFLRRIIGFFDRLGLTAHSRMCTAAEVWAGLDNVRQHRAGNLNLVIVAGPGKPLFVNDLQRMEVELAVRRLKQECCVASYPGRHGTTEYVHTAV